MPSAPAEQDRLVGQLQRALSRDPTVRLVVLHGSRARGDARPDSDLDLVVDALDSDTEHLHGLAHLALEATGIAPQLSRLDAERAAAPAMLLDVIDQGVVIIERDDAMKALRTERSAIEAEAIAETATRRLEVAHAFAQAGAAGADAFVGGACAGPLVNGLTRKAWQRVRDFSTVAADLSPPQEEVDAHSAADTRHKGAACDVTGLAFRISKAGRCIDDLLRFAYLRLGAVAVLPSAAETWDWACDQENDLDPCRLSELRAATDFARSLTSPEAVSSTQLRDAADVFARQKATALSLGAAAWRASRA
jgi:predicted nucleotidyltransferase